MFIENSPLFFSQTSKVVESARVTESKMPELCYKVSSGPFPPLCVKHRTKYLRFNELS